MFCKVKNIECNYAHRISLNGDPVFNEPPGFYTTVVCLAPGGKEQCRKTIMEDFVKRMIDEHKVLVLRISALADYIYNDNNDDKVEFANKSIQLSAMRKYEEALRARLENRSILVSQTGEYFEKVDDISDVVTQDINTPNEEPDEE